MTTTAVFEAVWNELSKRMADSEASQIMNSVRDATLAVQNTRKIDMLQREVSHCRACDNFEYRNATAVWNTETPDALVVLERPGIGEVASKIVTDALSAAGFNKSNTALTYLYRCLPQHGDKYKVEHLNNCFGYLEEEIFILKPKIVIASGKAVAEALLGPIAQVSKMRGELCWSGNTAVLVTFSPLYIAAESSPPSVGQIYEDDIRLAAQVCKIGED